MRSDRGLSALLFCSIFLPALAVVWHVDHGQVAFVLYREPKLACWTVLGWMFLATLWWREGSRLTPPRILSVLRRPMVAALGLFLIWATATASWVLVVRNLSYELGQYALLFFLWVCLGAHPQSKRWRRVLESGLLVAIAVLTGVGLLQAIGALSSLPAIDPQYGGHHASLMGYKNPMALALAGQLFLLAARAVEAAGRQRAVLLFLLTVEVGYLVTLLSRTSYLAMTAGCLCLAVIFLWRGWRQPAVVDRSRWVAVFMVLLVVGAVGLFHSGSRDRIGSALSLLASPRAYLETDRGVYLRNTLHMVKHRPWGVGFGDWQTHYPVYRQHERYRAYDDDFQVRRAHSDHVQTLGETGWLGFTLWVGFWVVALGAAGRRGIARSAPPTAAFVAAQLVAFAAAMMTDYVIEVPYLKLELFVVLLLALELPETEALDRGQEPGLAVLRFPMVLITLVMAVFAGLGLVKSYHSAVLTHHYLQALQSDGPARIQQLEQASVAGARFARLPGHEKTFYRSWLVLADTWLRLDQPESAAVAANKALELHPFNPGTYRWLGQLAKRQGNVAAAARWQAIYYEIMHKAETGPPAMLDSIVGSEGGGR